MRPDSIALETGQRLRFVDIEIKNLKDPIIQLSKGQLAMDRIYSIRPQPIGEMFGVVWDGDTENPALIIDVLDPSRPVRIFLEVWGR